MRAWCSHGLLPAARWGAWGAVCTGCPMRQGSEHETLATVTVKVPQAVFCLLTALQIHELTTQLPRQVWIAMPQGSHAPKMDYPPVKMVQFSGEAYATGVEVLLL